MREKIVPDQEYEKFVKWFYARYKEYPRFNNIQTFVDSYTVENKIQEIQKSAILKNLKTLLERKILKKEKKRYKPFQELSKVEMKEILIKNQYRILEKLLKFDAKYTNQPLNQKELSYTKKKALIHYELEENMKISFSEYFKTKYGLTEGREQMLKSLIISDINFDVLMKTLFYN